jgi:hypothetical protein
LYRRHAPLTQAKAKADGQIAPEAKATAQAGDQLENERTFPDEPEGSYADCCHQLSWQRLEQKPTP